MLLVQLNPNLVANADAITNSMIVLGGILIAGITGEDAAVWVAGKPKTPEEVIADMLNAWLKENKPDSTFEITPDLIKDFLEYLKLKNDDATQTNSS